MRFASASSSSLGVFVMTTPDPETYDTTPDPVFRAVGIALTAWEHLELALAELYSILVEQPRIINAYAAYGNDNPIFAYRVQAICKACERYFISRAHHGRESQVADLLKEASDLSIDRHRVAHGIVQMMPAYDPRHKDEDGIVRGQPSFWLSAPWYAQDRLKPEALGIPSSRILEYADRFAALASRVRDLNSALAP